MGAKITLLFSLLRILLLGPPRKQLEDISEGGNVQSLCRLPSRLHPSFVLSVSPSFSPIPSSIRPCQATSRLDSIDSTRFD
eukprot:5470275-Pyramimonas_sp.AAC.1